MQLFYHFVAGFDLIGFFQAQVFGKDITGDDGRCFLRHIGKADIGEHVFGYPGDELFIVFVEVVVAVFDDAFFREGEVGTELPFVIPTFDDALSGSQSVSFQFGQA